LFALVNSCCIRYQTPTAFLAAKLVTLEDDNRVKAGKLVTLEDDNWVKAVKPVTLEAKVVTLKAEAVTLKAQVDTLTKTLDKFWGLMSGRCAPPLKCPPPLSTCRQELKLFTPLA
jgi:hypothetical protein